MVGAEVWFEMPIAAPLHDRISTEYRRPHTGTKIAFEFFCVIKAEIFWLRQASASLFGSPSLYRAVDAIFDKHPFEYSLSIIFELLNYSIDYSINITSIIIIYLSCQFWNTMERQ